MKNKVKFMSVALSSILFSLVFLVSANSVKLNLQHSFKRTVNKSEINYSSKIDTVNGSSLYIDEYGSLYTFGANQDGQLGTGDNVDYNTPQLIDVDPTREDEVIQQAGFSNFSGFVSTYAITEEGRLYTWGNNRNGQLGLGSIGASIFKPTEVIFPDPNTNIVDVEIAYSSQDGQINTIALTDQGEVYVWGANSLGQLGLGNVGLHSKPVLLDVVSNQSDEKIVGIDNAGQMLAITENGDLYMWGGNGRGEVGVGNLVLPYVEEPTKIEEELLNEKIIKAGANQDNTYAIAESGKLYVWGANNNFQLGNGNSAPFSAPIPVVQLVDETIVEANISINNSYALTEDGKLYMWGGNSFGQAGNNSTANIRTPKQVNLNDEVVIAANTISPYKGNESSFALTNEGNLYVWGQNTSGQLGLANNDEVLIPNKLEFTTKSENETIIYADLSSHSFILTDNGNLYSVGLNNHGQLGIETTGSLEYSPIWIDNIFLDQPEPTPNPGDDNVTTNTGPSAGFILGLVAAGAFAIAILILLVRLYHDKTAN